MNWDNIFIKIYEWGFSEEERTPIGFIGVFALIIFVSSAISIFWIFLIDRLGWLL